MTTGRGLTASMETEVGKSVVEPFFMAELLFPSDPVRAWSGLGDLTWDSKTWLGTGELGKVSPIRETAGLQARGLQFVINSVPSAYISVAQNQDYQNKLATLYVGFFDDDGTIVPDPVVLFRGRMDQLIIAEVGGPEGYSRITVSAESRLIDLDRPRELLYDHEHQQALFPGDDGFEYVASLQEKEIPWGSGVGRMNAPRIIRPPPPGRGGR